MLDVSSLVAGTATGRRSVIIIGTKYILNDKQTIHTRVGTVSYMITLSIGESHHNTEGGRPGADTAEEPPHTTATISRVTPKVIDKTKEIQVIIYLVYIAVQKCGSPTHVPAHGPSD